MAILTFIISTNKKQKRQTAFLLFMNTADNIDATAHAVQKAVHTMTLIFYNLLIISAL